MVNQQFKLLVADDDPDDLQMLEEAFDDIGWGGGQVKMFIDGESLMRHLTSHLGELSFPSMILLDYNMPKTTGEELLQQLQQNSFLKHILVAFYSSGISEKLKERLVSLGAFCCFKKPSSVAEAKELAGQLKNMVNEIVYQKK